jgi:hypothetical protein
MGALSPVLRNVEGDGLMFWCPGCDGAHMIRHGDGPRPSWSWNGNAEKPTFSPSILVRATELTEKGRAALDAWRAAGCPRTGEAFETVPTVCHSFVIDGRIQFLGDCTHALAGQTVDLPEWDDSE